MIKTAILMLLCITTVSLTIQAEQFKTETLAEMVDEINRKPWRSYEKLNELAQRNSQNSNEQESNNKVNELWILMRKAHVENLLYFYDEFENTVEYASTLLSSESPIEISSTFIFYQGLVLQRSSQYQAAEKRFEVASKEAKKAKLNQLYLQIKSAVAYNASIGENAMVSLMDLQEAYVEAFQLNDELLVAMINQNYGDIYGYVGEYQTSEEYYRKALNTYQSLNYPIHIARAVYGLANTYRYWKKYDLAITQYERYIEDVSKIPTQNLTFYGAYGLGMTLAEKNDCSRGLDVINYALTLNGPTDFKAELYKRKASCLIALNKIDEAFEAIEGANDIFNSLPEVLGTRWHLEALKIIADLTFIRGDIPKAYALLNDYYQQYTQLLKSSNTQRISDLKLNLELEQKNIEIAYLQQQSQLQKLEVAQKHEQNKAQQYLILVILFVVVVIFILIMNQKRNAKKVYQLTITDALTGLYNRRYIFEFLRKRLDNNKSNKAQMTIMLVDINDFKEINDNYEHAFGDFVIQKVADICLNTLRTEDVVSRISGVEFLCALSRIDPQQCLRIARRLARNIEKSPFVFERGGKQININITVSIGLSQTGYAHHSTVAPVIGSLTLYNHASKALQLAKTSGKTSVVDFSEISE